MPPKRQRKPPPKQKVEATVFHTPEGVLDNISAHQVLIPLALASYAGRTPVFRPLIEHFGSHPDYLAPWFVSMNEEVKKVFSSGVHEKEQLYQHLDQNSCAITIDSSNSTHPVHLCATAMFGSQGQGACRNIELARLIVMKVYVDHIWEATFARHARQQQPPIHVTAPLVPSDVYRPQPRSMKLFRTPCITGFPPNAHDEIRNHYIWAGLLVSLMANEGRKKKSHCADSITVGSLLLDRWSSLSTELQDQPELRDIKIRDEKGGLMALIEPMRRWCSTILRQCSSNVSVSAIDVTKEIHGTPLFKRCCADISQPTQFNNVIIQRFNELLQIQQANSYTSASTTPGAPESSTSAAAAGTPHDILNLRLLTVQKAVAVPSSHMLHISIECLREILNRGSQPETACSQY